jgi:choline dehydrogenase
VLKGHTRNRAGQVNLKSANPREATEINFRYFDDAPGVPAEHWQEDLESVREGVEFVRRMNRDSGLKDVLEEEVVPGETFSSREALNGFIKKEAWGHHASCTCKIGPRTDPMAVVDGKFRVHGVSNLRVVDASVFPEIPGLFIVSAIYMIGEKAADDILNHA